MTPIRCRYQTIEFGDEDIHVRSLRDRQQYADDDGEAEALGISSAQWPLFGMLWDAAHVLAHLMSRIDVGERRVLEVGSGLGLASLVLNRRGVDITATDYHPEAGAFLAANTALNEDAPIPFHQASWADGALVDPAPFDLLIASDVLYERGQVAPLAAFLVRHAAPACEFIVVDSNRGFRPALDRALAEEGFARQEVPILDTDFPGDRFPGTTSSYRRGAGLDGDGASVA